jgi:hypothetical protein
MAEDPFELKKRMIKREQQVQQIQQYAEEQDKLDKEQAAGALGPHQIKNLSFESEVGKIPSLAQNILNNKKSE